MLQNFDFHKNCSHKINHLSIKSNGIHIIVIYHFKHVPQFVKSTPKSIAQTKKNDWIWPLSLCYKYCNITTMSMLLFGLNVRGARLTNMRKKRKQARLDLVLCTNKQLDLRSLFFAWISLRYWKNLLPWPERGDTIYGSLQRKLKGKIICLFADH